MSEVWNYFTKDPIDKNYAICNFCNAKLSRAGGCTTPMRVHLRSTHKSIQLGGGKKEASSTSTSSSSSSSSTRPAVQPGIKQSLAMAALPKVKPMGPAEQESLRRSAAWMCAVDVRPLSLVNSPGFRNFCYKLNPNFKMPDRHAVATYVKVIYDEGHKQLKKQIEGCGVGLTTDLWTSHCNEGYITVTAQFITADWVQLTRVLGTRSVKARHTGEQVSMEIQNLMTEFEIPKCYGICTDNASNMKVIIN